MEFLNSIFSIFAPIGKFFVGIFGFIQSILSPIFTAVANFFAAIYEFIQHCPLFTTNLFNFIIVAGFFIWLLFFKLDIIDVFAKKRQQIINSINSSENRKNDSIKYFNDTKDSLKNINKDIEKIDADAKSVAQKIEEQNAIKIQKEIEGIENRANILKVSHQNKAKEEVSQKIASAAIAVSKEYIENSLDENTQKELIYDFINNLESMRVE